MMRMVVMVIGRVRRAVPQCSADPRLRPVSVKCMFNCNGFVVNSHLYTYTDCHSSWVVLFCLIFSFLSCFFSLVIVSDVHCQKFAVLVDGHRGEVEDRRLLYLLHFIADALE